MSTALTANEIRESFLKFFESKKHTRERSSSLIPHNDPTLLFTNAGMNQFKDCFTGNEKRSYVRATTCQKCVRAGGKHNDLESVGFTKRHQTFFEMLGNFSFGDYFKKEAIEYAWEFLTEVVKLPKDKLWISVFEKDDEAEELWKKISGLPANRIVRMGEKDNFWAMGDTGPCGPCSEIYIDRGETFGKKGETIFDGGERFLEIWNLVFMQFEKFADGTMKPLPKPSVDTGMGLERLASVLQNVESNYLIDSMQAILQSFAKQLGKTYGANAEDDTALRVLTDHIRAVSFLISDGVQPSNEGRGYVLRRILRRAIRYGKKLGCQEPFFYKGVDYVQKQMGKAYPEFSQNVAAVSKMIYHEEEKFFETLENGLKLLESKTSGMKKGQMLAGNVAFQLYDTFGFPLDLTEVILKEKGLELDVKGFDEELLAQRTRSKANWKGSGEQAVSGLYKDISNEGISTSFVGYESLESSSKVLALISGGKKVEKISAGDEAEIILDKTPFYAEGGGQVGDQGILKSKDLEFSVENTFKPATNLFVHRGKLKSGELKVGANLSAQVDKQTRLKTRINHTITHVLHATLQEILGDHIKQAGSLVHPDYLRFDFSHFQQVQKNELRKIENIVNARIRENSVVEIKEEELEKAIAGGAKAFFDEKYGEKVRVLSVGSFSKELCGGTHAERLGEAGLFKIVNESSVASGVRRIVAVTGQKAYDFVLEQEAMLETLSELLKSPEKELPGRVEKLLKEKSELQKKIQNQSQISKKDAAELIQEIEGVKVIIEVVSAENAKDLRPLSDNYKQKLKRGVVVIGAAVEGRATVLASVTDDIADQFQMPKFVEKLSSLVNGKGGGRPNFAQVGGSNTDQLNEAKLAEALKTHLQSISALA
ncbi:MAG: alanine--tRNA ligase [Deltaproteobacteria bacterium]|nr:alanine--tRNA ligase [Deltaproteobacteria bacterium]